MKLTKLLLIAILFTGCTKLNYTPDYTIEKEYIPKPLIHGHNIFDQKWWADDSTHYWIFSAPVRQYGGEVLDGQSDRQYKCTGFSGFYDLLNWEEGNPNPYIIPKSHHKDSIIFIKYISDTRMKLNHMWYSTDSVPLKRIWKCNNN